MLVRIATKIRRRKPKYKENKAFAVIFILRKYIQFISFSIGKGRTFII